MYTNILFVVLILSIVLLVLQLAPKPSDLHKVVGLSTTLERKTKRRQRTQ